MSEANVISIEKSGPTRLGFKYVDPVAAARSEKRHIEMLIPGLKEGTIGVLAGDGGIGKSSFMLGLAYGLAHPETDVFGLSNGSPKRVLILSAEDDDDIINNRMHDFDEIHGFDDRKRELAREGVFITADKELMSNLNDPLWIERLKLEISHFRIDLVVFDTYSVFGNIENENDNAEAAKNIKNITDNLIGDSKLCVILSHHTNANGDIRGAKALRMNTRATYILRRPNEEEEASLEAMAFIPANYVCLELVKTNYAQQGVLCWLENVGGIFTLANKGAVDATLKKIPKRVSNRPVITTKKTKCETFLGMEVRDEASF